MPPLPSPALLAATCCQPENNDCHSGTTGDSTFELPSSSASRSAIGHALDSTAYFGVRKPHSGAPIAVHSSRREPLFGPSGSRVYDQQQAMKPVMGVKLKRGREVLEDDDVEDDGGNAMATLSAAALDAGRGGL